MLPFTIDVPQERLDWISRRLREFEPFEQPVDIDPLEWQYGTDGAFMRELLIYWTNEFDWRAAEQNLNRLPHFKATAAGPEGPIDLHFIHEKGSGTNPTPLILLHGWPGSFFEFLECIEPLAHPERFGGNADDGCDVIVPSLVGYGYSGKPPRPIDPRAQAQYMQSLMKDVLGYDNYVAQGGDWGSSIAAWMACDDGTDKGGACRAVHLNMFGLRAGGDFVGRFGGPGVAKLETDEEKAWARSVTPRIANEMAYQQIQRTKPQSLSYAMMDSPAGTAAWIVEKFHRWSDNDGNIESAFSKDQLLTNIMIYLTGRCFHTAAWQYASLRDSPNVVLPKGEKIMVPTGFAKYPEELGPIAPRSYLEKAYGNIIWLSDMPRGGHFAALEEPELFVADVRGFLKKLD